MKNRDKILQDLKTKLKFRFGNDVSKIILFGSRANGNPKEYSDFDILIILKNDFDWKYEREISDLCYQVELKYGIITDEHLISEKELQSARGQQPVFLSAIKNGIYA